MIEHYWNSERFEENWFNYQIVYKKIVESTPHGGSIVEVGAWKGASTSFLAVEAQKKNMNIYVVDTWLGSNEHKQLKEVKENLLFDCFIDNIRPVVRYVNIIRLKSHLASRAFDDSTLDAVFIDAEHTYESTKLDIDCWLPKIKDGGILAGHDYIEQFDGVIKAVSELPKKTEIIDCNFGNKCWYYIK